MKEEVIVSRPIESLHGFSDWELEVLGKPTAAFIGLTDTVDVQVSPNDIPGDFDAILTTWFRHLLFPDLCAIYGVGSDLNRAAYGVELITNLVDQTRTAIDYELKRGGSLHPNIIRAHNSIHSGTIRTLVNIAQRSGETAATNGTHFYLALLDNGMEIYTTPLKSLQYVRDRIVSLWEIPNENHPLFNGEREQFRSSTIARSGEYPSHLRRIVDVREVIPGQQNFLQLAFVDKFGNLRLRQSEVFSEIPEILADYEQWETKGFPVDDPQRPNRISLVIGDQKLDDIWLTSCLNDIPEGEWGFYRNSADPDNHYWELVVKDYELTQWGGSWALLGKPELGMPALIV